uniref:Uncharacterized protein n=1 Tax=Arundo donax TaxID=35708 RepID=A0A0A9BWT4_ARUDO
MSKLYCLFFHLGSHSDNRKGLPDFNRQYTTLSYRQVGVQN